MQKQMRKLCVKYPSHGIGWGAVSGGKHARSGHVGGCPRPQGEPGPKAVTPQPGGSAPEGKVAAEDALRQGTLFCLPPRGEGSEAPPGRRCWLGRGWGGGGGVCIRIGVCLSFACECVSPVFWLCVGVVPKAKTPGPLGRNHFSRYPPPLQPPAPADDPPPPGEQPTPPRDPPFAEKAPGLDVEDLTGWWQAGQDLRDGPRARGPVRPNRDHRPAPAPLTTARNARIWNAMRGWRKFSTLSPL